jgi:predicted nucleic-acid-binding Zn-ribbon protein
MWVINSNRFKKICRNKNIFNIEIFLLGEMTSNRGKHWKDDEIKFLLNEMKKSLLNLKNKAYIHIYTPA